jgi:phosphatidylglycerophosphatase A
MKVVPHMPNPRRVIHWEKVRGFRGKLAFWTGTGGGAGLMPFAPGTSGTLVGVPLHYWSADWDLPPRLLLWGLLFAVGVWAAKVIDEQMGSGDHQSIVIDEVVGYGVTAWTAGTDPLLMVVAFVVFRVLDVVKPPPIRQVDSWSKKKSKQSGGYWGGFGVMADDLVAALMGLAFVILLQLQGFFGN